MAPYQTGGDMIEYVLDDHTTWNVLPHKFEAGTPNVAGAVGLAAAVDYLDRLGMDRVAEHERSILETAVRELGALEGVRLLGPPLPRRSGVVSFVVDEIHPHDLATVLDQQGVCVRAGHHCAQPLMRRLGVPATTRASFYVYTDVGDVARLAAGIVHAQGMFATPSARPR
jgi:cysteine desulfurase/selenocysteine lyase